MEEQGSVVNGFYCELDFTIKVLLPGTSTVRGPRDPRKL